MQKIPALKSFDVANTEQILSFSYTAAYLDLLRDDKPISCASGLVASHRRGVFLVTALHNFTGKEPQGRQKSFNPPNEVRVRTLNFDKKFPLFDGVGNRMFGAHPKGPSFDISVLQLTGVAHGDALHASFLTPEKNATVTLHVAQVAHIVGYPIGWKQVVGNGVSAHVESGAHSV